MNSSTIQNGVDEIAAGYSDNRFHVFDLKADMTGAGHCVLSGTMLDEAVLSTSLEALAARHPEVTFDAAGVRILRQEPLRGLIVSTNLAGVHGQPSRTTEMLSQVLNGTLVEQLKKEGSWAFVRQQDGYLGWIQRAYATADLDQPTATHMVAPPVVIMVAGPAQEAIVSRVFAGTAVHLAERSGDWTRVNLAGDLSGWVHIDSLRPLDGLPQTGGGKREQMVRDALHYTGVQYRWGGCTVQGIDCSGLVQLLHHLCGISIPRDADMQFSAGTPVEPPFQAGDLLFFGGEGGHRSITHVGMSLGGWQIIHSSGPRNGVYRDDVQAVSWLRETFAGARRFIAN